MCEVDAVQLHILHLERCFLPRNGIIIFSLMFKMSACRTEQLALAGNLVITLAKFLAYLHSGSSAMSSEAMHSLVDSANQLLLVVGLRTAAHAPDKQHQYGYGERDYCTCSLFTAPGCSVELCRIYCTL